MKLSGHTSISFGYCLSKIAKRLMPNLQPREREQGVRLQGKTQTQCDKNVAKLNQLSESQYVIHH